MSAKTSILKASHNFVARPYEGLETLDDALNLIEIELDGKRYAQGSVSLLPDEVPFHVGSVEIYLDGEGLNSHLGAMGIDAGDVKLACIAFGTVVAEAHVVLDDWLEGLELPVVKALEGAPFIFEGPNGFDLRAFMYLGRDLKASAFRPHRVGTWLAYAEFRVAPHSALSRFCPTPLDDQTRQHYGLPKDCLTYIRVGDGILESDSLEDEVDAFVDVAILRLLQENSAEPLATYIQLDLVTSTIWAVLSKAAVLLAAGRSYQTVAELSDARRPIASLISAIAQAASQPPSSVVSAALDDPGMARSAIESYVKSLKTTSYALREVM